MILLATDCVCCAWRSVYRVVTLESEYMSSHFVCGHTFESIDGEVQHLQFNKLTELFGNIAYGTAYAGADTRWCKTERCKTREEVQC